MSLFIGVVHKFSHLLIGMRPGLAACSMKAYGVCSKAFIKLESLDGLTSEQRHQYEELSVDIFAKYADSVFFSNYGLLSPLFMTMRMMKFRSNRLILVEVALEKSHI